MADLAAMVTISLSKARKQRNALAAKAIAAANRVKFGRAKSEKALERARSVKAAKSLDGAKLID